MFVWQAGAFVRVWEHAYRSAVHDDFVFFHDLRRELRIAQHAFLGCPADEAAFKPQLLL